MNYTALYRTFRPQNFKELVGQEHISTTLLNGIRNNKIAHAYLFSGPRGTGKTSTAKIFAKAINCLNPQNEEPCNECLNCTKISQGNSMDVIEIDAASNRGIDEIRDLREKVKYVPAEGKYKVYIIDEVHMLTTEAFNALLKTLEEPPKHIVFILATTEAHKLPATIISRCQRFDFKRIAFNLLIAQLKKVAGEVGISAEDKALIVIAKKAEGGMRDALSLLDQSAAFGNGNVTYDLVLEILGAVRETEVIRLLASILSKNAQDILKIIEDYVSNGKDLKAILYDLQDAVRNAILAKLSATKPETVDEAVFKELRLLTENIDNNKLYKILEILAETENTLKYAAQARVTLEVGLLRTITTETPDAPKQYDKQEKPVTIKPEKPIQNKEDESKNNQNKKIRQESSIDIQSAWQKLLDETKKTKRIIHAFLIEGNPVAFSGNTFKIEFEPDKEFHYQQITMPENMKIFAQIFKKMWGENTKPDFTLKNNKQQDDLSKKVIDLFGKDKVELID